MTYSLNDLYRAAGLSKQAVQQARSRHDRLAAQVAALLRAMDELRTEHPGCGLEKAYYTLKPTFLGRDRCIALLQHYGYGLSKRAQRPRTTRAGAHRFANLIAGRSFDAPGQVWQSDLTYVDLGERFGYVTFLIDIYTKVIVGYQVSGHMRAEANLRALRGAIQRYGAPRIHHSDRGSQYSSSAYMALLREHGVDLSMAQSGPENAYAERINGTIKNEYLVHWPIPDLGTLKRAVARAVGHYNAKRIHNHLGRRTPLSFVKYYGKMSAEERPVVVIPAITS